MTWAQEFLLTHSFAELRETYGVNARPSADGSKWSLNYDQVAAKPGCPVADQCRGLVIRPTTTIDSPESIVGDTVIVARPADRFFNADDPVAAKIDWSTARVQEKLDGTCCILYYDYVKREWCIATRAVSEADVLFGDPLNSPLSNNTFAELFKYSVEQTLKEVYGKTAPFDVWAMMLDPDVTYVYELTTPINRVVVKYNDYRVTLWSARITATGEDVINNVGYAQYLQIPEEWPLKSLADITAFVNCSDPAKIEGAVVIDDNNNRVKVKSKAWILASQLKDMVTLSKRGALRSVIDGSITNVLPLLDTEVAEYITQLQSGFHNLCKEIDADYRTLKYATDDRKQFALAVQNSGLWATPFYVLYSGKHPNTLDWLQKLCETDKLTDTMLDTILNVIS